MYICVVPFILVKYRLIWNFIAIILDVLAIFSAEHYSLLSESNYRNKEAFESYALCPSHNKRLSVTQKMEPPVCRICCNMKYGLNWWVSRGNNLCIFFFMINNLMFSTYFSWTNRFRHFTVKQNHFRGVCKLFHVTNAAQTWLRHFPRTNMAAFVLSFLGSMF